MLLFFLSVCVVIDVSPVRVCHFILPHRDTHTKKKKKKNQEAEAKCTWDVEVMESCRTKRAE